MTAARSIETDILVVGGGPVGLTLAGELGWRGAHCMLLEERTAPTTHPKATLLGARSMELFRRWGITDQIYARALPQDARYAITFSTRLAGHELHRVSSPSIRETIERPPEIMARHRDLHWSPYSKTQIGQQALEPVLWDFAAAQPSVTLRHGWRLSSFVEEDDRVCGQAEEVATGRRATIRARYLVACDGGGSSIRRSLGIRMNGRGRMRANVSFYFRSPEFLRAHDRGLGNLYFVMAPDSFGVFTAIDGAELWNFQYYFLDPARETQDIDATEVLHRAVGRPFAFELLGTTHWHHHQSVARSWRSPGGRVFLAGDAAHLFAPTGGVGMNTGIGDAIDLAWKLDGVIRGWGGAGLLDSYEAERKPVAWRNSVISANNSDKIDAVMDETPACIDAESPEGDAARAAIRGRLRWMSRQFSSAGTHLGYRYVDSPVIAPDGSPEPPDDPSMLVPSTWPGMRSPHAFLGPDTTARGASTLDWFGRGWVLCHASDAPGALLDALLTAGLPVRAQPVPEALWALFERALVLVRPDGHVAWRGDEAPDDAAGLADLVRGKTPLP
jgi:2-polyprenyl-6-methoxyphenol hydroxylase-like FAD-dependent oxidoreductase